MTPGETRKLREEIRRSAAVVDGWPEWKRRLIHLLGHPRNTPDKNREQQARNETTTEKAGIERDG